jgi:acyl-coenzyme A synthetase/AMP-(fatty) acid ligase
MRNERKAPYHTVPNAMLRIKPLADALSEMLNHRSLAPAVVQGNRVKSYQALSEAAHEVAEQLLDAGIKPGQRIVLDLPRSIELYEAILGCLIAGISFMSLPRGFGVFELVRETKKANCVGILSNIDLFPSGAIKIHSVGNLWKINEAPTQKLNEIYCVRTSGTTGEPKVVPTNDIQLSAFLENSKNELDIAKYVNWLWSHDLSFDYAIWETLSCLTHCGCLVVLDEFTKRDPIAIMNLVAKTKVNVLSVTPSEFKYIFYGKDKQIQFDDYCLTDIIFAGERLATNTFSPFFHSLNKKNIRLFNVYGPTETAVFCSYHHITEDDLSLESIPIGKPFSGINFRLTSTGELTIHGAQVFEGYDGSKLLTNGYETGDICRLDEHGRYVFVGRSGGYQKINGFRVKTYEIEEHLQSFPDVDEAVVWIENSSEDGDFLLAYVRVQRGTRIATRDLRQMCSTLPPYMRPAKFFLLYEDQWPINERGKTDRQSLRRNARESK